VKKNKSLTGMKGLELKGGYCFVKKNGGKKTKARKGSNGKTWSWG